MLDRLLTAYRRSLDADRRMLAGRYRYADAAHKVVGVGSVGTRAWIVLMIGRDADDPLFLQAKEAQRRCWSLTRRKCPFDNQGRRVVEGQRVMQAASDIFLGWLRTEGLDGKQRDFYIRQLWDGKRSADVELMVPKSWSTTGASAAGRSLVPTLARAIGWRSPPISARATPSTRRSPTSPRPTPTRTSATTK